MRAIQKLRRCWSVMMLAAMGIAAKADTVFYDNDTGRKGGFYNSGGEFGDEVLLGSDALPTITGAYVVVGPNGYTGGASVSINIRALDGPVDSQGLPTPGTSLGSGSAPVPAISRATRIYVPVSATLKNKKFVWTAQILGASSTVLGIVVADAPTGGSSLASELWANNGTTWATRGLTGGNPANLAVAFLTSSGGGSEVLRVGGGSAGGVSTSLSYREGTAALSIGAGSLVAFDGTKNLTIEVPALDAPLGDELLANGQKGSKLEFANVSEGQVRDILAGLQYQNLSKSARGGAHQINVSLGGLNGSMTVNLTAVNDAPVVALGNASQATVETASFAAGAAPVEVPFTYLDPESGVANVTVAALSDNEQVIKNANLEVVLGAVDATGRGTGVLKIKAAEVATGTAYPDGLPIAIIATDRSNAKGSIVFKLKVTSSNKAPAFVLQNVPASGVFEINEDTVLKVPFTLSDDKTPDLVFKAVSDKPALISASSETIAVKSDAGGTFFEIKPVANQNEKSKDPSGAELGVVKLTLSFDDKEGGITARELNVRIVPVNDAPVLKSDKIAYTVEEDAKTFQVPFTLSDADVGDVLSVEVGPGVGEVTVGTAVQKLLQAVELVTTGAGAPFLNVTVAPGASGGPAPIKLIATDSAKVKTELDFAITITEVNDAPAFAEMQNVLVDGKATDAIKFKVLDEKPVVAANLSAVSSNVELVPNDFTLTRDGDFWVLSYNVLAFADASFKDASGAILASKEVTVNLTAKDPEGLSTSIPIKLTVAKRKSAPLVLIGDTDTLEAKTVVATADNGETFTTAIGVDDLGTLAAALKVEVTITGNGTTAAPIADAAKLEVTSDATALGKIRNVKLPLIKDRSGVVTLVVKVTDADGDITEKTLNLTVKAPSTVNTPPVIDIEGGLTELVVTEGEELELPFDLDDAESEVDQLEFTAIEAPTSLLSKIEPFNDDPEDPAAKVLSIGIKEGATGTAVVRLQAKDTGLNVPKTIKVVNKKAKVIEQKVAVKRAKTVGGAGWKTSRAGRANKPLTVRSGSVVLFRERGSSLDIYTYRLQSGRARLTLRRGTSYGQSLPAARERTKYISKTVTETLSPLTTTKTFSIKLNSSPDVALSEEVDGSSTAVYPALAEGKIELTENRDSKPIIIQVTDPDAEDADALTVSAFWDDEEFEGDLEGGITVTPIGGGRYSLVLKPSLLALEGKSVAHVYVVVSDPNDETTYADLEVTVKSANAVPVVGVKIADQVVKNNAPFEFQIPGGAFDDADPADKGKLKLTAKLVGDAALPSGLTLSEAGVLKFTPSTPVEAFVLGKYSVVVTATDLQGASVDSAPFIVDVIEGNRAPIFDAKRLVEQKAIVGQSFAFSLVGIFSDADGDDLTFGVAGAPAWLNFNSGSLLFSGRPEKANLDAAGKDISVTATDAGGKKVTGTFKLSVALPPNRAPRVGVTLAAQAGKEGKSFGFVLPAGAFTDVDEDDVLTLGATLADGKELPSWLKFDSSARSFAGTPTDGDARQYLIKITATDGAKASVSQTFPLTIAKRPAPVKLPIAFSVAKVNVKEDAGTFQINLVRTGDLSQALSFTPEVTLGLPLTPAVVTLPEFPSSFGAGEGSITLTVGIKDDGKVTGALTGTVRLSAKNDDGNAEPSFELTVQNTTGGDAAKYVTAVYTSLLARTPDEKELTDGQTAIVAGGADPNAASALNARRTFVSTVAAGGLADRAARFLRQRFQSGSVSATSALGVAIQDVLSGSTYSSGAGATAKGWLRLVHHDLFGRAVQESELPGLEAILSNGDRSGVAQLLVNSSEYRSSSGVGSLFGFASTGAIFQGLDMNLSFVENVVRMASTTEFYTQSINGGLPTPSMFLRVTTYAPSGDEPAVVDATAVSTWGVVLDGAWEEYITSDLNPLGVQESTSLFPRITVNLLPPFGTGQLRAKVTARFVWIRDFEQSITSTALSQSIAYPYSRTSPSGGTGSQATATIGAISPDHVFTTQGQPVEVSFSYQATAGVELSAVADDGTLVPSSGLVIGGGAESKVLTVTPAAGSAGDTKITVIAKAGDSFLSQQSFELTVLPNAPVINADPVDVVAVAGGFATFDVRATGAGLAYQWERYNSASGGFETIPNETFSTYSTSETETVRVKVSNLGGVDTSQSARVIRPIAPVGVVSPAEGLTVDQGAPATLRVTQVFSSYSEPAPVVSWLRFDEASGGTIVLTQADGVSADGRTLTIANARVAGRFFARIQDKYSEWVSAAIPLKVRIPLSIAEQPAAQSVKLGETITLKVKVNGDGPFEYQWRKGGQNLRGVFTDTYTIPSAKLSDAATYYVVVSKVGSEPVTSNGAKVAVETQDLGFNDSFASAGSISGPRGEGGGSSETASSGLENGEPRVIFNGPGGVLLESAVFYTMWTRWTAPAKGVVTMDTVGSSYDTILGVYSGSSIGVLQKIAEDDDSGPNRTSRVTANVTAGTQYYIRVGLRSGEAGAFAFGWSFTETALTVPSLAGVDITFTGTAADATAGNGALRFAAAATGDGPLTYKWYRSKFPLVEGSEGTPPVVNSGTDAATFTRSGKFSKLIGDYYLVVSNPAGSVQSEVFSIRSQGSGNTRSLYKQLLKQPVDGLQSDRLLVKQVLSPAGGRSIRSQALGVVTLSQFSGSQLLITEGESVDVGEPNHAGVTGGASVWFSITPPSSGRFALSTEGETDFDTVLAVYTGKTNALGFLDYKSLVEVASDNNSGANGLTSRLTFVAEAGKEYFIAVDGVNGTSGVLEFAYKLDVAPTLTGLKDVVLKQNSAGSTIQFKADDSLAGAAGLTIRLLSSDPGLIDPAKIVVGSSGTDRSIVLTPEFNRTGTATLTLLVDDGANVTTGTLNVTVEAVNQRPEASDLSIALAEDTTKAVVLGGVDPEGKVLTYKVLTQPIRGKLTGTAPNLTYTPNANTFGNDQFTYLVNDGELDSTPATVTLSIVSVNDAPSITKVVDVTGKSGTPTDALSFTLSDIDSAPEAISVLAQSDNPILVGDGNIVVSGTGLDRTVTVYPSAEKTGKAVITLTAIDEGGGTATSSFTLSIASAPPTLATQPQSATVLEGNAVAFVVQARGTGPFTYQWRKDGKDVVSRTGGTFSIAKVTPADAGKYSVVVKTPVGTVTSEEATLTVTPKVVLPTKLSAEATVNGFVLHFTSAPGPYRLQGSVDLINWVTLTSEDTTTGVIDYTDKDASKNVMRFYRVIQGR